MNAMTQDVPSFPFERGGLAPPAEYVELRERSGLSKVRLWDGSVAWLATRYDDVRALLADNRFSANTTLAGFPHVAPGRKYATSDGLPQFIRMDPPEHGFMRRMLTKEFTHSRIQALRPMVTRIIHELFDALLEQDRPADLVEKFAFPLPSRVIGELLGIPYQAHAFFQECSHKKIAFNVAPEEPARAGEMIRAYLLELLREKERHPESHDDIMGRLIVDWIRPGHLSHEAAVTTLELLLMAGHETTANMLSLGTLSLLQNPLLFSRLKDAPSEELIRRAVEEMLRFHTILQFTGARIAREDVQFQGHRIRAGEGILAMINAANRDPNKFADPNRFDVDRKAAPHVAFGFGIHQCLGQPLARLELQTYFELLPRRMPTLELAIPFEQVSFRKEMFVHGVDTLPITW